MDSNGPEDIFHLDIVKQRMIKKKELKFANLNFTIQVRHFFQVLRVVISRLYVLFPGSMFNHRPV